MWQRLYGHDSVGTPKFRVGDRVRISKRKRNFEKGYMANCTEELFTIVDAHRSDPPVYRLVDWHGDTWDGTFYEPDLNTVVVPKCKTIELSPFYGGVTREGEFLQNGPGSPHPSTVG